MNFMRTRLIAKNVLFLKYARHSNSNKFYFSNHFYWYFLWLFCFLFFNQEIN